MLRKMLIAGPDRTAPGAAQSCEPMHEVLRLVVLMRRFTVEYSPSHIAPRVTRCYLPTRARERPDFRVEHAIQSSATIHPRSHRARSQPGGGRLSPGEHRAGGGGGLHGRRERVGPA